jgi:two-component system response regulator HydG
LAQGPKIDVDTKVQILIVETDKTVRSSLSKLLEQHNYSVSDAASLEAAREKFNIKQFDLIICDLLLLGASESGIAQITLDIPVLVTSNHASLSSAVETMRKGAADFICKPLDHSEVLKSVVRITSHSTTKKGKHQLKNNPLVGNSQQILKVISKSQKLASTVAPILIIGEFGSGRTTLAKRIHGASSLSNQPFIAINCAAISEQELREKAEDKVKKTLFFNNICELPIALQAILASIVDHAHIRIIASTQQDLTAMTNSGKFRKDLLYNLSVLTINVPPLRERAADIPMLAKYYVEKYSIELGYNVKLTEDVLQELCQQYWEGNVKQLRDHIYQAMVNCDPGELIALGMTKTKQISQAPVENKIFQENVSLEDYFINYVLHNQQYMSETQLAKNLGISRKSLWERRNKLSLKRQK